eukprot:NODE_1877_length_725_cov_180.744083_g1462_i0.p1 GENE.NODE_1877_length_725_cov_180.744083_g1462_i0~~NODE_1877_length_725_cov_180.744083_g1462_i0.p1  ORF type:complete len:202 (+),score=62.36 NODE_1877_length_725_cov_180.744083_g1462_i0:54-608(+)
MVGWSWKSDLRTGDSNEDAWTPYTTQEAKKIEKAYKNGEKKLVMDKKYHIDFKNMIQHRADDYSRQRDIRRDDSDSDSSDAPPRKKAKKSPGANVLKGCVIAMSGTLSETRAQIATKIEDNGGEFSKNVTYQCTHLITTPGDVASITEKVREAKMKGIDIVSEDWLTKSLKLGVTQPVKKYACE